MGQQLKDPGARVEYGFDWDAEGQLGGRSIEDAVWSVVPAETNGVIIAASRIDGAVARAAVEGGLVGRVYRLSCRIALSDGETDERQMTLRVEDR